MAVSLLAYVHGMLAPLRHLPGAPEASGGLPWQAMLLRPRCCSPTLAARCCVHFCLRCCVRERCGAGASGSARLSSRPSSASAIAARSGRLGELLGWRGGGQWRREPSPCSSCCAHLGIALQGGRSRPAVVPLHTRSQLHCLWTLPAPDSRRNFSTLGAPAAARAGSRPVYSCCWISPTGRSPPAPSSGGPLVLARPLEPPGALLPSAQCPWSWPSSAPSVPRPAASPPLPPPTCRPPPAGPLPP